MTTNQAAAREAAERPWHRPCYIQCPICGNVSEVNTPMLAEGMFFGWRCRGCENDQEIRVEFWPADEGRLAVPLREATNG